MSFTGVRERVSALNRLMTRVITSIVARRTAIRGYAAERRGSLSDLKKTSLENLTAS